MKIILGYKIPELVKDEKIKARKLSYDSPMHLLMLDQLLHVFSLNELADISKIYAKELSRIRGITSANLNTFSNANRAKGQGFYVANDTYFAEATAVKIVVEDVQAFSNGEPIDVPENVGFYGNSTYYLADTYSAGVTHNSSYWGVQFQTSKSKYGDAPLPLTLRMKAQMIFH